MIKCEICGKEFEDKTQLGYHIRNDHNMKDKEYYDLYMKKDTEGKCFFCGKDTDFLNLYNGYSRKCNSKECLSKSRASGTLLGIMYKNDINEEDAKILMDKRTKERSLKITEVINKKRKENPNFFKEKSINCPEFYLKRGFSNEEAIKLANAAVDHIHKKTSQLHKDFPERYDSFSTTQTKYWGLKKVSLKKRQLKKLVKGKLHFH